MPAELIPVTLSPAVRPYKPSIIVIPFDGIQCLHSANECFCWSTNIGIYMSKNPTVNVDYWFVLTSSTVSNISWLSWRLVKWEVSSNTA